MNLSLVAYILAFGKELGERRRGRPEASSTGFGLKLLPQQTNQASCEPIQAAKVDNVAIPLA
jgi:hypothetical protein